VWVCECAGQQPKQTTPNRVRMCLAGWNVDCSHHGWLSTSGVSHTGPEPYCSVSPLHRWCHGSSQYGYLDHCLCFSWQEYLEGRYCVGTDSGACLEECWSLFLFLLGQLLTNTGSDWLLPTATGDSGSPHLCPLHCTVDSIPSQGWLLSLMCAPTIIVLLMFPGHRCALGNVQCRFPAGTRGAQAQEALVTLPHLPCVCLPLFSLHWSIAVSVTCNVNMLLYTRKCL